jgi:hypothetical protein
MNTVKVTDGHVHGMHTGIEMKLIGAVKNDCCIFVTGLPVDITEKRGMFSNRQDWPVQVLDEVDGVWYFTMCMLTDFPVEDVAELFEKGEFHIGHETEEGEVFYSLKLKVLETTEELHHYMYDDELV